MSYFNETVHNPQKMCDYNCHNFNYQYNHSYTIQSDQNMIYSCQSYNNLPPLSPISPPLSAPNSVSSSSIYPPLTDIYQSMNAKTSMNNQHLSNPTQSFVNQNFCRNNTVDQNGFYNYQYEDNFYGNFFYEPKCPVYNQENNLSNILYNNDCNNNQWYGFGYSNDNAASQSLSPENDSSIVLNGVEFNEKRSVSKDDNSLTKPNLKTTNNTIKIKTKKTSRRFKDLFEPSIDLNQPNVTTIMQRPVDMGETKRYRRRNQEDLEKRRIFACKYAGKYVF